MVDVPLIESTQQKIASFLLITSVSYRIRFVSQLFLLEVGSINAKEMNNILVKHLKEGVSLTGVFDCCRTLAS